MSGRGTGFWLLVAAAVVIVATVTAAIVVMGSPAVQRERRMDETRVQQLMQIERAVRMVHEREGRLPGDLAALGREPGLGLDLSDPQTAAPYGYQAQGANAFRLCAAFARNSADDRRRAPFEPDADLAWRHPAGNHCFAFRIDPTKR